MSALCPAQCRFAGGTLLPSFPSAGSLPLCNLMSLIAECHTLALTCVMSMVLSGPWLQQCLSCSLLWTWHMKVALKPNQPCAVAIEAVPHALAAPGAVLSPSPVAPGQHTVVLIRDLWTGRMELKLEGAALTSMAVGPPARSTSSPGPVGMLGQWVPHKRPIHLPCFGLLLGDPSSLSFWEAPGVLTMHVALEATSCRSSGCHPLLLLIPTAQRRPPGQSQAPCVRRIRGWLGLTV